MSYRSAVIHLYLPEKSLVGGGWVGGRPNLVLSPGPGLWSLVLGSFRPDLGPDLGPGPGLELDNFFIISSPSASFLPVVFTDTGPHHFDYGFGYGL